MVQQAIWDLDVSKHGIIWQGMSYGAAHRMHALFFLDLKLLRHLPFVFKKSKNCGTQTYTLAASVVKLTVKELKMLLRTR